VKAKQTTTQHVTHFDLSKQIGHIKGQNSDGEITMEQDKVLNFCLVQS
jgi:hypothetical protein